MNRRDILKTAGLGAVALQSASTASAGGHGTTGYVLVHGSWHGGWCWGAVASALRAAGHPVVAIDLPGCGLNAVSPAAFYNRPLDPAAFATETSQFARLPSEAFADAVLDAAAELRAIGADRVVAAGHSMGGMPITLAAAKDPSAIQGLVFVTALTAIPGKPAGAYLAVPAQKDSKLPPLFLADPAKVGALRIDPASPDANYAAAGKAALAADVPDDLWRTATAMMTPDAPAAFYGDVIDFADGYDAVERTFVRCGADQAVMPGTQDAIIADLNAAWPDNPCRVIEMDSSHEVMFADPAGLAAALMQTA